MHDCFRQLPEISATVNDPSNGIKRPPAEGHDSVAEKQTDGLLNRVVEHISRFNRRFEIFRVDDGRDHKHEFIADKFGVTEGNRCGEQGPYLLDGLRNAVREKFDARSVFPVAYLGFHRYGSDG